jgi:hypothetical protein
VSADDWEQLIADICDGTADEAVIQRLVDTMRAGHRLDLDLVDALELNGNLPRDSSVFVLVSSTDKFVQIVLAGLRRLAADHGLSRDERHLLQDLAYIVDHETAEAKRCLDELADELVDSERRLRALFAGRLGTRGLVESYFPRGHMGRIRLRAYPAFVRLGEGQKAREKQEALVEYLATAPPLAPGATTKSAGATWTFADPPSRNGRNPRSDQGFSTTAVSSVAQLQKLPLWAPKSPERTGLSPMSASREASDGSCESRENCRSAGNDEREFASADDAFVSAPPLDDGAVAMVSVDDPVPGWVLERSVDTDADPPAKRPRGPQRRKDTTEDMAVLDCVNVHPEGIRPCDVTRAVGFKADSILSRLWRQGRIARPVKGVYYPLAAATVSPVPGD